jgi:hypothetical protein
MKLRFGDTYANAVLGLQPVSEDGLGDQHGSSAWLSNHASEARPSSLKTEQAFVAFVAFAPNRRSCEQPRHRNEQDQGQWSDQRAGRGRSNTLHAPTPSSSRGFGLNGATTGHPALYETGSGSYFTRFRNERRSRVSLANERTHFRGPRGSWNTPRQPRDVMHANWRRNNRFHPEVMSTGHWNAFLNGFVKQTRRDIELIRSEIVNRARTCDQRHSNTASRNWGNLVHRASCIKSDVFMATSPGASRSMPPTPCDLAHSSYRDTVVRVHGRRAQRQRTRTHQHHAHMVEEQPDNNGPHQDENSAQQTPSTSRHGFNIAPARLEPAAIHPLASVMAAIKNRVQDTLLNTEHITPGATARARTATATGQGVHQPPALQPQQPHTVPTPSREARINWTNALAQISRQLATLTERVHNVTTALEYVSELQRNQGRTLDDVQDRSRSLRRIVDGLVDNITQLNATVDTNRQDTRNVLEALVGARQNMFDTMHLDMSEIPRADESTIIPDSIRSLLQRISSTSAATASILQDWNTTAFDPNDGFNLEILLYFVKRSDIALAVTQLLAEASRMINTQASTLPQIEAQPPAAAHNRAAPQDTGAAAPDMPAPGRAATDDSTVRQTVAPATGTDPTQVTQVQRRVAFPEPILMESRYTQPTRPPLTLDTLDGYNDDLETDSLAPLTPTHVNVTIEQPRTQDTEPEPLPTETTDQTVTSTRLPSSGPDPASQPPPSAAMAIALPPPLTRDEQILVARVVRHHCPIELAKLLADRARETRGLLSRTHHLCPLPS